MNALQVHLFDIDLTWNFSIGINVLVEALCKLMDVKFPWLSLCNTIIVNLVGQVLKPHQDLVLVQWQQHVGLVLLELHRFLKLHCIR